MEAYYRCLLIFETIFSFLLFSLTAVFHYFGEYGPDSPLKEYFDNNTRFIFEKPRYLVGKVTPSLWTFWMWAPVYGWQVVWLFFAFILLCRPRTPVILTPFFFVFFLSACGFNLGWVMLWTKEMMEASFAFMASTALCLFIALALLYRRVNKLVVIESRLWRRDFVATQWLPVNGLAMYAAWATVMALINLAIVLKDTVKMEEHILVTIILACFACIMFFWFCVDCFVLIEYTAYTLTVFPALVVGFTGMFWRGEHELPQKTDRNAIMLVTLLAVSIAMSLAKVALFAWQLFRDRRVARLVITQEKYEMQT